MKFLYFANCLSFIVVLWLIKKCPLYMLNLILFFQIINILLLFSYKTIIKYFNKYIIIIFMLFLIGFEYGLIIRLIKGPN